MSEHRPLFDVMFFKEASKDLEKDRIRDYDSISTVISGFSIADVELGGDDLLMLDVLSGSGLCDESLLDALIDDENVKYLSLVFYDGMGAITDFRIFSADVFSHVFHNRSEVNTSGRKLLAWINPVEV